MVGRASIKTACAALAGRNFLARAPAGRPTAPDFKLLAGAGHFVFLAPCNEEQIAAMPALCTDADGVDRKDIRRSMISEAVRFFAHALGKPTRAGMQTADQ